MARRSAIGLDIGTTGVRAAEISPRDGEWTLEKFGQVALPEGAVREGEVSDPVAVGEAIKALWSATKFSHKRVVLGVANHKVIVRQVELPWLPVEELNTSLPFHVEELLPMPVEKAILDFYPLEEAAAADGSRQVRGLLVAADRDMVAALLAAVGSGGLDPVRLDLTSFAVLRSLADRDELGLSTELEALVDIGARITNIVVHQGGVPRFVRILVSGGQDITDAVAERLGVPNADAEALKQAMAAGEPAHTPELEAAARAMEVAVNGFVDEVRGSLDYFSAASGNLPILRLVATGGGSQLSGLDHRLSVATRLPVTKGSGMAHVRAGETGLSAHQLEYVEPLTPVPVGLALGVHA